MASFLENVIEKAYQEGRERLDLSRKELYDLPESIGKCTNLKLLDISHNRFDKIPESITQLTYLEELYINDNHIKIVADDIQNLSSLQVLDIRNNNLDNISESIGKLINLRMLGLNSENIISGISKSIQNLKKLEILSINQIELDEKAQLFLSLDRLRYIILDDVEFSRPPLEVVAKGFSAIYEYFQQLETEGIDYLYEAKLLIVGEGGAGKTTLANKIIDPNYQLCDEDTTRGIEVKKWEFPIANGKTFTVNIWDFGGQEIYHATHQYFLTKRSLYALVTDSRREDTDFYYWLSVIDLLSDNSPIAIIKNEKQNRQGNIKNLKQLRGEFGNLKDSFSTNLADNRGLDNILENFKFYLQSLPHIGSALPKTWVKVRHILESDQRNYISLNEYFQICIDNGFKDRKNALQLCEYLHDLGICLHFQDNEMSPLYQTVILKPKWGTDAAYAVLDNPQIIRNFGHFSNKELAQIWSADEYTGMHSGLLELMKKFQLCYEIPQEKGSYIAPQLLTDNQPEYYWDETDNLILRYSYEFMPKGLVRQFIVAMHQDIEAQTVWRSGVIINVKNIDNTRAEVIENYGKREIKIRIYGKNKRDLLTVVTHELDKIHNSYKRLADKYQKRIPCNCSICKGSQNPHFYEFDNLKRRYENHKKTVECNISYENVLVASLIGDVGFNIDSSKKTNDVIRDVSTEKTKVGDVGFNIYSGKKTNDVIRDVSTEKPKVGDVGFKIDSGKKTNDVIRDVSTEKPKVVQSAIYRYALPSDSNQDDKKLFKKQVELMPKLNPDWIVEPDRTRPGEDEAILIIHKDNYLQNEASYIITRSLSELLEEFYL